MNDETAASVDALFDAGLHCMRVGDSAGALAAFRQGLALSPQSPELHVNLGLLLLDADQAQAERHYRAAIDAAPWRIEAYLHLGALLAAQKRFDEAELNYRLALAVDPDSPAALSNLGVLLASTGREGEAKACYRAAIAADPAYQFAHFNQAYLLLRDGDYPAGWRAFEARQWYGRLAEFFGYPRWHGEALHGKSLMIAVEAGHGDMIQFCRYASLARQAGAARVGIVCHEGLRRLFASLAGIDAVYGLADEGPREGWDYWTPPLSMPGHFGTTIDTIPAQLPYLNASAADLARLAPLTAAPGEVRVGLAWQGNPRFENDGDRSIARLATLAPLASVPGVRFFSLQKGEGELARLGPDQAAAFPGLVDLSPHIADFADTAALIATLDLVISVDTAVAHLAGALGKPCWVLLPAYQTDWRWLRERTDSPWYPGVLRLFRQQQAGDWDSVIDEVRRALADFR